MNGTVESGICFLCVEIHSQERTLILLSRQVRQPIEGLPQYTILTPVGWVFRPTLTLPGRSGQIRAVQVTGTSLW